MDGPHAYDGFWPIHWVRAGAYFYYELWWVDDEAGKSSHLSVPLTWIIALATVVPIYASAKRLRRRWRGRAGGFAVILKQP